MAATLALTIYLALMILAVVTARGSTRPPVQPRYVTAKRAICQVFGRYCTQALRVSYCETGGTYSVYAHNGQYLGLFQMGTYARGRYGHSWDAWGQAKAAYHYFIDSGRDWSPWECKP